MDGGGLRRTQTGNRYIEWRWALLAAATSLSLAACASSPPAVSPALPRPGAIPSVVGTASWYGPGFHGHRTSSGQIYNQEDLTAASTQFALGTRLLVTNLDNGRAVEVTVNDHGPFVKGRKIDLSRKAARVLGMIGPGTANVRMDVLSAPAGGPPIGERYFVQMGSFAQAPNAERLRERLAARYSNVTIDPVDAGGMRVYRVRMGAFPTREEAEMRASSVADFGMPVVVIAE